VKMAEVRYEHPLEYYTVDNFIKESQKMIGQPVSGMTAISAFESAKHLWWDFLTAYARAVGDDNPLHNDINYALETKYGTLVALPTFLVAFKYPMCEGSLFDGPYPLVGLEAGYDWEWNDVVKMNDKLTAEHVLKDVYETTSEKGRTVNLVSECRYLNKLSKELVATCRGTYAAIARAESIMDIPEAIKEGFRRHPITDRKVYHWTDNEVKSLIDDCQAALVKRGSKPLYWDDVNVGDKIPQIAKGPLTTGALIQYINAVYNAQNQPNFELHVRKWLKLPGALRYNTLVGWPYDFQLSEPVDPWLSEARGMPYMFGMGSIKLGFCAHLLSNWMGDDGFIRRLKVNVLEPYIYGDALWIKGEVVDKYKEKIGGALYGAVEVKVEVVNQLHQNVASGDATVYLPSENRDVELPISGN